MAEWKIRSEHPNGNVSVDWYGTTEGLQGALTAIASLADNLDVDEKIIITRIK